MPIFFTLSHITLWEHAPEQAWVKYVALLTNSTVTRTFCESAGRAWKLTNIVSERAKVAVISVLTGGFDGAVCCGEVSTQFVKNHHHQPFSVEFRGNVNVVNVALHMIVNNIFPIVFQNNLSSEKNKERVK